MIVKSERLQWAECVAVTGLSLIPVHAFTLAFHFSLLCPE